MRLSTLVFATLSVAAVGDAFLIPPEANKQILEDEFTLMSLVDPNNRVLRTLCKGCMDDGSDGHLIYTLVVSNLGKPAFLVNGADLTPFESMPNYLIPVWESPAPSFSVPLVKASESFEDLAMEDLKPREVQVVYNLLFLDTVILGGGEVVQMTIEAKKVGDRVMKVGQVENVNFRLVREAETNTIVLTDAKTTTPKTSCDNLFCEVMQKFKELKDKSEQWGKQIHDKFKGKGGCRKKSGDDSTAGGNAPAYSRPHHHHPHRPEDGTIRPWHRPHPHHHHPHGRFGHGSAIFNILRQVLLPIVIGVGAGMLVSLMGMVVGHFAVMAYRRATGYRRCGQHGAGDEEVNKGLLSEEQYTDEAPPQYEAGEVEVNGDEKQ